MKSINEIIEELNDIIKECRESNSRLGYFAVLYKMVTVRIRDGILNQEFEDNPRMEVLDVLFANRYIDAYRAYKAKKIPTASWLKSFEAGPNQNLLVLQHLLLGINAHINLDLGIAVVETMKGKDLKPIENDYTKINDILAEMTDAVKANILTISPIFKKLLFISNGKEDILINFSINQARKGAWSFAQKYSEAKSPENEIIKRDQTVAFLAKCLIKPGWKLAVLVKMMAWFEKKSVAETIDKLENTASNQ